MRSRTEKNVVRAAVGISGILWILLLLRYYMGLDPTDIMGYGILAFFLLLPVSRFSCLRWQFPPQDSAGVGYFRYVSARRNCC